MEHAVKSYENELDLLRSLTLSLGKLTGEQLGRALEAIESSGADRAARVIDPTIGAGARLAPSGGGLGGWSVASYLRGRRSVWP